MVDVAAEAHVSVKTVSRVVNDEAGVREETATRVRAVIERLGFQRHDGARHLRGGRTSTIGLVVEDLANPFYSQIGAAVEREARRHQHLLITASAEGSPTRERAVLDALVARRLDGVIVVPAGETPTANARAVASGTPVVYVDRPVRGPATDTVLSDNVGGVRSAVEHLVAHGHQRVGFLGDDLGFWTARQRRDAFTATHQALRLPGQPRVGMGPHTTEGIANLLREWTAGPQPVTALLTGNNRITVLALHALRDTGRTLSLVGYDDFELADLVEPAVTVVHQDPGAMGQKATQQLFARLAGDDSPPETVVIPTRLIVRGSGTRPVAVAPSAATA
ncbi:LacI family DNA-binding transcriptional regulator [Janibacter sp. G1551]|uniref:LacI family DNA-binding transcriptional regulator n=1 Tax=Janibacter sp. G1551 TaxID=3420440 RepID=UPI003D085411